MVQGFGSVWVSVSAGHVGHPFDTWLQAYPNKGRNPTVKVAGVHGPNAVGAGSVWGVSGGLRPDFKGPRTPTLVRVDPTTGQVVASVALPSLLQYMSYSNGVLWLLTVDRQVIPFDTSTDTLGQVIPLPMNERAYSVTAVGSDAWVSLYGAYCPCLVRVDGATAEVSREHRFRGIAGFATDGRGVWALTDDGLLSRFDIAKLKTDEILQLHADTDKGFSPWTSALDTSTSTIWVANYMKSIAEVKLS